MGFLLLLGGVFVLRLWLCEDAARVKESGDDSALCCVTKLQQEKKRKEKKNSPLVQRGSELKIWRVNLESAVAMATDLTCVQLKVL